MRKTVLLLFFTFFTIPGWAQHYNFRSYSVPEGLAQSQVYAICQDSRGNMWFGTQGGGISIFDGYRFSRITQEDGLSSNFINAIYEDAQGLIWVGSMGGLDVYNGENWKRFNKSNGLSASAVYDVIQGDLGHHWFATSSGIARYYSEDSTFRHITTADGLASNLVRNLVIKDEALWAGTERGVNKIYDDTIVTFSRLNKIRNKLVRGLAVNDTVVWAGTYGGGITAISDKPVATFSKSNGLNSYVILCLFMDQDGNLWIGTEGGGVVKYDGRTFKSFEVKDGLTSNSVRAIYQDREGNMWFGTSGGGVSMLDAETFVHFGGQDGLVGNGVYSIAKDTSGNMWFGTFGGGVTVFDGVSMTRLTRSQGLTNLKVKSIYINDSSEVFIGSEGDGLFIIDSSGITNYKYRGRKSDVGGNWIKVIQEDHHGRYWIGTSGGGLSVKDSSGFRTIGVDDGLVNDRVNDIAFDLDSSLWIATDNGISRMDSTGVVSFKNGQELDAGKVKCVEVDSFSRPWFGTAARGLRRWNGRGFDKITTRQGLTSNTIYLLHYDREGHLWVGSEQGLDKIILDSTGEISSIHHFGKDEGFTGIETCQNAVYEDSLGYIWFGTVAGVTRYNMRQEESRTQLPQVHITNVMLPYEPITQLKTFKNLSQWYHLPDSLVLSHNENHITFEFLGIHFRNPGKVQYRWRLAGFEKEWSPPSDQRRVTYSNLDPGSYIFEVEACNSIGQWNESPATYSFSITSPPPPIYELWWFQLLLYGSIALILSLIGYIIFYRIVKRNKEVTLQHDLMALEQKALRLQMNPHFLFNCLNSIKGYISANKTQEAKLHLSKFAKLMRSMLDNSRASFISVEKEVQMLKNYLELEQLSHEGRFTFEITTSSDLETETMNIPPMVVQPFVENALLHGILPKNSPGHLTIHFSEEKDRITCAVTDDGIGRRKAYELKKESVQSHKSAAISIIKERFELLNDLSGDSQYNVKIVDLYDDDIPKGTRVEINLPITE